MTIQSEILQIKEAAHTVRSRLAHRWSSYSVGVVLGSGLGDFPTVLHDTTTISYNDIPHMPKVTVASHHGQLISGFMKPLSSSSSLSENSDDNKNDKNDDDSSNPLVLCFAGRVHSYEGIPWQEVCFIVRLLAALGTKLYIVTNATGGMIEGMGLGSLCLLTDHFRYMARKDPLSEFELPEQVISKARRQQAQELQELQEKNTSQEEKKADFPVYWDSEINEITRQIAREENIQLFEGSYVWTSGPSFETPMEVMTAKNLGGACVGMSTVPEVITAHAYGMSVLGISMVTNLAAGLSSTELNHEEVYTNANNSVIYLKTLLRRVLLSIGDYLKNHCDITPIDHLYEEYVVSKPIVRRAFPTSASELKSAVDETVTDIKKALSIGDDVSNQAYVVCCPRATQVEQLKSSVKIVDLKKFPILCSGSNYGSIALTQQNELVVLAGDEEGFTVEESAFIAIVLYSLGVSNLSHLVHGKSSDGTVTNSTGVTQLFDLYHFHDTSSPLHPYLIYLNDGSLGKRQFLFPYQENQKRSPSYMSFCGPSEPSYGEYHMAREFGVDFVGTTSVATIYAARYLGLNVNVYLSQNRQSTPVIELIAQITPSEKKSDTQFGKLNYEHLDQKIQEVKEQKIKYDANISFDKLQDIATSVLSQIEQVPQLAVVDYDLNLVKMLGEKRGVATVDNEFLAKASQIIGQNADLLLLEHQGKRFYAVSVRTGIVDHAQQEEMKLDWSNYVRLLQHLGVKHIVFTQAFIATNVDLLGQVVSISDHANLTGANPMIGPNNDLYGPRFFDMSHVYTGITTDADKVATVQCLHLPMVRSCRSLSEFVAAKKVFNADVVMSQASKESIISQHCNLVQNSAATMLGVVDEAVNVDNAEFKSLPVSESNQLAICDVILRKLEQLQ